MASSEAPTVIAADGGFARGSAGPFTGRGTTPSPLPLGFAPGQVVGDRYRIVGLLGRGGMGEVYRADDLKLGSPVALKFLPRDVEADPALLERLHSEVRNARQVSHPHVCRVYDIGEIEGRHFLTMEYVDGEDLATLLHRIGRLPPAKALEIARQLCAGLAAAHEKGVLHRDLKPANVMIDGHGRARIADFGLAVSGDEAGPGLAGTPAYMAPEQLSGQPASVQSDLYALGLVLYEIFTGRRAFEATTLEGWREAHGRSAPTSPSLHTSDMDPLAERVILRCLEKDPAQRPRSALQVALALPGGDPLAAAIAAGETPSPEMVAAAGGEGALSPRAAWSFLGAIVLLLAAIAALCPYSTDLGLAPMERSPDSLRDSARAIASRFGYSDPGADETTWLQRDYDPLRWLADHVDSVEWRARLGRIGSPVLLHLRRSAEPLVPDGDGGVVTVTDPPPNVPGDLHVVVDAEGRLREMQAVPPRWSMPAATPQSGEDGPFPEEAVFRETGMDRARFEPVAPEWTPPLPFDARREWTGTRAEAPEMALRLSAAAFGGKLTSVEVLGPWSRDEVDPLQESVPRKIQQATLAVLTLSVFSAAIFFARRNLRLGRGDRQGALRVGVFCFVLSVLAFLSGAHLSAGWSQLLLDLILPAIFRAASLALLVWLAYVALEPYVRRRMPDLLVGWARVLEGRLRDPRVGRDILTGLLLGTAAAAVTHVVNALPTWHPFASQTTIPFLRAGDAHRIVPLLSNFGHAIDAITRTLTGLTLYFACRLFVSSPWLSTGLMWVPFFLLGLGGENALLETPAAALTALILTYATTRTGVLALALTWFTLLSLSNYSVSSRLDTWYAPWSLAILGFLLGLAIWSFVISLGGRSPFGSIALDA